MKTLFKNFDIITREEAKKIGGGENYYFCCRHSEEWTEDRDFYKNCFDIILGVCSGVPSEKPTCPNNFYAFCI